MNSLIDWATYRARMIITFVIMSIGAGTFAYLGLPKEGSPDIDIPVVFVSVPFVGISAQDSEKLLVKPMETRLKELDGIKRMTGIAAESYGALVLEFEFDWDKDATIANIRDKMSKVEAEFPTGADKYTVNEINFSQFPILVVSLSGELPERTLLQAAKNLQTEVESLPEVLEVGLAGHRDEMLEVIIDPLRLESYNVTAGELINVVTNNNKLIAAGNVETDSGAFSVKIPSSFNEAQDVYNLPVKVNGDSIVTLGELANIKLTFEDLRGTARFNGEKTVALQIIQRKGSNIIDTVEVVKAKVLAARNKWPIELKQSVSVNFAMDLSKEVEGMVGQLESSVLTAIALVMIVVLASLGMRSALLVGFAIPTSFLLCFALLAIMGISISNMVMFGLILAVGMLVDGAIVVVEYADKRIQASVGPMKAYGDAAKRMFWPIVSSTATTLCAFLPMLFWPGVPGEFMGMLPVTLIFVLSASLIVALIYLPVVGGVAGRLSRLFEARASKLRERNVLLRLLVICIGASSLYLGLMQLINPNYLFQNPTNGQNMQSFLIIASTILIGSSFISIGVGSIKPLRIKKRVDSEYRRTLFGRFIHLLTGNPIMPIISIGSVAATIAIIFTLFSQSGKGVEFFVETDPERAIAYIQARGNLSVYEKDNIMKEAEQLIIGVEGVNSVFAFAGDGGLDQFNPSGPPGDTIGQIQIELTAWDKRSVGLKGKDILITLQDRLNTIPGIRSEIREQEMGPGSSKPVHLRIKGNDFDALTKSANTVREKFENTKGLIKIEDNLPEPGIDWQIDVDVEKAGRYGADVVTVGAMVQLVTGGLLLDTMRVDSSDEEIDIRVRLPKADRLLSTIDTLKVRTASGLIPLSNFISRTPVKKLAQINRVNGERYFDVKADVETNLDNELGALITPTERIALLTEWLTKEVPLESGVSFEWTGDDEEQAESQEFLQSAFMAALGLMFVILLAQFNSFYNSVLVLLAVILSTTGVLVGMMVMDQNFSVIMTGTGIVALAGIVVNNNIVLIDTYQEYSNYMPKLEAIVRTAEDRIRPVLLTTITTMAGLTPMMYGLSLDFFNGGYTVDSPTALWWKQLATAVVFGLGIATVLTLIFTPSMLALREWVSRGSYGIYSIFRINIIRDARGRTLKEDFALRRAAKNKKESEIVWAFDDE